MPADTAGSPFSTLQYIYSWLQPHLPPTIDYIISNLLKGLASLPPSVANVVPLLVGGVMTYWAIMTAFNTVRSTVRQSWFLMKWGSIALIVAYIWSYIKGEQPIDQQQNNPFSAFFNNPSVRGINGGIGGFVNQAARQAGLGGNNNDILNEDMMTRAYNSFVPYPLRMLGNLAGLGPNAAPASTGTSGRNTRSSRRNRNNNEDINEQFLDTANVATEWLGSFFKKAGEVLEGKDDRWSESRRRRANNQR